MSRRRRGLLTVAAAFVLLFFGAGLSTADAGHFDRGGWSRGRHGAPRSSFYGRFGPRHHAFVHARPFLHYSRSFYRPYRAPYPYFVRPHRFARVFVPYPYPRFAYRRVYYGGYGADCW